MAVVILAMTRLKVIIAPPPQKNDGPRREVWLIDP